MLIGLLLFFGCGGDSSLSGSYEVREVRVQGEEVAAGRSIRTNIYFDTKTDPLGEPESVELVAEISPELEYLEGSSYIYERSTDREAHRAPDDVLHCQDGRTLVVYYLDRWDLEGRELVSKGEWALRIYVRGRRAGELGVVAAAAAEILDFSCSYALDADESDWVRVVP